MFWSRFIGLSFGDFHNKSRVNFLVSSLFLGSLYVVIFSYNTSALFTPTLSVSINNSSILVNGNQVISSSSRTYESSIQVMAETDNRTGYTITLNTETEETALVNTNMNDDAKINTIVFPSTLANLPDNTWAYRTEQNINYSPIPALSNPKEIKRSSTKTNGRESNMIRLGFKLDGSLENGTYKNKLIISTVSNPYNTEAVMTMGDRFNQLIKNLAGGVENIDQIKRSAVLPENLTGTINIEDGINSDCEIRAWYDATIKTVYYYTETEKIYLNMDSSQMFSLFSKLKVLELGTFDTSRVEDMGNMFTGVGKITSFDVSNFDTRNVMSMQCMFSYAKIESLDLHNFNTEKVTDAYSMFAYMSNLKSLDISTFKTQNVTKMSKMFYGVDKLEHLDVSSFDTSKVKTMAYMFYLMSSLESLNVSNFNTMNVEDLSYTFAGLKNVTELNLTNFYTPKLKLMSGIFRDDMKLRDIKIPNFNTENVTDMGFVFDGACSMRELDLSSFNTENVVNVERIFGDGSERSFRDYCQNNDNLERILVSNNLDISHVSDYTEMFIGRHKLRGEKGSYLNYPQTAGLSWLRIDGGSSAPGYLTQKI